jgi:hypothetical protein
MTKPTSSEDQVTIHGFLFSKLGASGSKSEGPVYFLQKFDGTDLEIEKDAALFEDDPVLHVHLATKVTLIGCFTTKDKFSYSSVVKCSPPVDGCQIQYYHVHQ